MQTILQRQPIALHCSDVCRSPFDLSAITLPVDIRDAEDQTMAGDVRQFLTTGRWKA